MLNKIVTFTSLLCVMLYTSMGLAAQPMLQSGQYESLLLAVTPDNKVEAYYSEISGEGVTRRCSFYLKGDLVKNREVPITSWSTEILQGIIVPNRDSVIITIPQGSSHDGCMGMMCGQVDQGLELSLIKSTNWIGLVTITAEKVYLKSQPSFTSKHSAYVVRNDVVSILKTQKEWTLVEFINENNKTYKGWIHTSQFAPVSIPVDTSKSVVKQ